MTLLVLKPTTNMCLQQWRIQGRGPGGPAPPYFCTKLSPPTPHRISEGLDPPLQRHEREEYIFSCNLFLFCVSYVKTTHFCFS